MSYFVLLQKKEKGCPIFSINGVFYDSFVQNVNKLHYGFKPWYALDSSEADKVFPEKMFLISKDKLIDYDIRSQGYSLKFYVVSEQFLELLNEFSIPIKEQCPLEIVNSSGKPIAKKKYFVIRLSGKIYLDKEMMIEEKSVLRKASKSTFMMLKPIFKNEVNLDLFKLKYMDPGQDVIFCSEKFYEAAIKKKFRGMEFVNVLDIKWSSGREPILCV